MRNLIIAGALTIGTLIVPGQAEASWWNPPPRPRPTTPAPAPQGVPELNAQAGGSALALVLGGVAVVLGRRRRAQS